MSAALDVSGLTDAVLEAAASRGLLRRAARDVEAGLVQPPRTEAGAVVLVADGETVRLGPGGLAGASCTCPAPGVCRHVLSAVLALRNAAPAPGGAGPSPTAPPTDTLPGPAPKAASTQAAPPATDALAEIAGLPAGALAKAFGTAALGRAETLLSDAALMGEISIEASGPTCTVAIPGHPPVHYVAGAGPAGMVSKASNSKALHAAALLAVRRMGAGQQASQPAGPSAPAPSLKAEAAFLDAVAGALLDAARTALVSAPPALEDRLLDLAVSLRADALPILAGALRGVAADMAQRRARAAEFAPWDALVAIARAYALVEALRRHGGDLRLRGTVRGAFEPHRPLDLLGCGVALWHRDGGARGATAYFLPAGGGDAYTATLARAAGQDAAFVPATAARLELVWGETLQTLGHSAFHLPEPAADAGNCLSPRASTRAVRAPGTWGEAAAQSGLVLDDWSALGPRLAQAFAPSLRRPGAAMCPVLLRPAAIAPPGFDPLAQATTFPVQDRAGAWLELRIEAGDDMDRQVAALAGLPGGGAGSVLAVLAGAATGEVALSPIACCIGGAGDLHPLAFLSRSAPAQAGLAQRLRQGLAAIGWREVRSPSRFERLPPPDGVTTRVLDTAADEVLALAELGGRMDDSERMQRLRGLAQQLEAGGMAVLGAPLARLADAAPASRAHGVLAFVHLLSCWRRLNPVVPLLRPA